MEEERAKMNEERAKMAKERARMGKELQEKLDRHLLEKLHDILGRPSQILMLSDTPE